MFRSILALTIELLLVLPATAQSPNTPIRIGMLEITGMSGQDLANLMSEVSARIPYDRFGVSAFEQMALAGPFELDPLRQRRRGYGFLLTPAPRIRIHQSVVEELFDDESIVRHFVNTPLPADSMESEWVSENLGEGIWKQSFYPKEMEFVEENGKPVTRVKHHDRPLAERFVVQRNGLVWWSRLAEMPSAPLPTWSVPAAGPPQLRAAFEFAPAPENLRKLLLAAFEHGLAAAAQAHDQEPQTDFLIRRAIVAAESAVWRMLLQDTAHAQCSLKLGEDSASLLGDASIRADSSSTLQTLATMQPGRNRLPALLGTENDAMSGWAGIRVTEAFRNLFVLPADNPPPSPTQLSAGNAVLNEFRAVLPNAREIQIAFRSLGSAATDIPGFAIAISIDSPQAIPNSLGRSLHVSVRTFLNQRTAETPVAVVVLDNIIWIVAGTRNPEDSAAQLAKDNSAMPFPPASAIARLDVDWQRTVELITQLDLLSEESDFTSPQTQQVVSTLRTLPELVKHFGESADLRRHSNLHVQLQAAPDTASLTLKTSVAGGKILAALWLMSL